MARSMTRDELLRVDRAGVINQARRTEILGAPGTRLVTVTIPQLAQKGPYKTSRVTCHRDIAAQLQRAFALIEALGLLGKIVTYDGCYNDRTIQGSTSISTHAYGAAIDLNASWNPLGKTPAAAGATGSVREVIGIFEACGFGWGGFWSRPDGMHFEVRELLAAERLPVLATAVTASEPHQQVGATAEETPRTLLSAVYSACAGQQAALAALNRFRYHPEVERFLTGPVG